MTTESTSVGGVADRTFAPFTFFSRPGSDEVIWKRFRSFEHARAYAVEHDLIPLPSGRERVTWKPAVNPIDSRDSD